MTTKARIEETICPVCDSNNVRLVKEKKIREFKKERFETHEQYYICENCKLDFAPLMMEEANISQVYNQYRERHNLPFPEEIKAIREYYDIAATKMSEILGFGVNVYRNYENGDMPSDSNARLIRIASDPVEFKKLVTLSKPILKETEFNRIMRKVNERINEKEESSDTDAFMNYVFEHHEVPSRFTGYKTPSFEALEQMVIFFAQEVKPWKTVMNKLLFYADFLNFKRTGYSISGCPYRAISLGPVPSKYDVLFSIMEDRNSVCRDYINFPSGATGEKFLALSEFNTNLFSKVELDVLIEVCKTFGNLDKTTIVNKSHEEIAWQECSKEKVLIDYQKYAFNLLID